MKKFPSLFALVAGSILLGACGVPEEGGVEEVAEVQAPQEGEVSAMQCYTSSMGSDSSCKSTAAWKSYASSDCASLGLYLSDYTVHTPCEPGAYRYVTYTCCR